jgi:hypothetical protein
MRQGEFFLNTDSITSGLAASLFFAMRSADNAPTTPRTKPSAPVTPEQPVKQTTPVAPAVSHRPKPNATPAPKQATRSYIRRTFDIFDDQLAYLMRASLEDRLGGGEGSMNTMALEVIDAFIEKRKRK